MKNLIQVGPHTINMDNVTRVTERVRNKEVDLEILFNSEDWIELTGIEALEFGIWLDKNSTKIKE